MKKNIYIWSVHCTHDVIQKSMANSDPHLGVCLSYAETCSLQTHTWNHIEMWFGCVLQWVHDKLNTFTCATDRCHFQRGALLISCRAFFHVFTVHDSTIQAFVNVCFESMRCIYQVPRLSITKDFNWLKSYENTYIDELAELCCKCK